MGTPTVGGNRRWYRLVRRLATRPSSELSLVYVPDGSADKLAVLKRLPKALSTDPAAVEKFRVEARIAALLEHPSIVRTFEIVESPAEDFYTMEYVRGADMRQLMDALVQQKRTLPLDCVLLIAIELCNALDYAHHLTDENGVPMPVIHRELSPSKVLLGSGGEIKLTGFGAPPVQASRPRRSRTESVGYTPPERCLGETMDSRSDVFALGVLIYELSSGQPLFGDARSEQEIVMKIVRGDMPRPSEVRRGYPRELETILMRALARDRSERFQSAAQLQVELETFLWSRWPTASTMALAKLVSMAFPSDEAADLATGSRELERIDPFTQGAAPPSDDPVLWLGPVPLAKPYPRVGDGPRTDTKELKRLAPETIADGSQANVALGASGPSAKPEDLRAKTKTGVELDRAATYDELAIPLEDERPAPPSRRNANVLPPKPAFATGAQKTIVKKTDVVLGTPGPKPSPLGIDDNPRARAFAAASTQVPNEPSHELPRGQYQRPAALDENASDDDVIEMLRAKQRAPEHPLWNDDDDDGVTVARTRTNEQSVVARVAIARVATPASLKRVSPTPSSVARQSAKTLEAPPATPVEAPRAKATMAIDVAAEFDLDKVSQLNWTLIPGPPRESAVDIIKARLPSPPPAAIAPARKWPIGTIAAIAGVVVFGVIASAWAIRSTQHATSDLPEVVTAHPSPPTDLVLHTTTTQKAPPAPAVVPVPKKVKAKPIVVKKIDLAPAAAAEPPKEPEAPKKVIPPLFPPPDNLPVPPEVGSLDGLPSIKTIEVKGTTADLAIRKAVEQTLSPLRGCYRAAARAKQQTPKVELSIAFEIDARRAPVKVRAIGGGPLEALAACATKVTSDIRDLPAPQQGNVRVSVSLEFRPNP